MLYAFTKKPGIHFTFAEKLPSNRANIIVQTNIDGRRFVTSGEFNADNMTIFNKFAIIGISCNLEDVWSYA